MKKKFGDGSPQVSVKQCQILKRTMRTLLQDLAQKSLKGLGTKARTNWEDRSANSLAYQVSNHDTFLYAGCISLPSSHRMRDIFRDFKGYSSALELGAWRAHRWYFVSEHAWRDVPPLENTSLLVNNPGTVTSTIRGWHLHSADAPPWQGEYTRFETQFEPVSCFCMTNTCQHWAFFLARKGVLFWKTDFFQLFNTSYCGMPNTNTKYGKMRTYTIL